MTEIRLAAFSERHRSYAVSAFPRPEGLAPDHVAGQKTASMNASGFLRE
jgi:hypothetical protein